MGSSATAFLPTKGKQLAETPSWTVSGRAEWDVTKIVHLGLEGKWVDDRYATDVNDEVAPGYTVIDADLRFDIPDGIIGLKNSYLQFNVSNLTDAHYLGSISSRNNAITIPGVQTGSAPTYNIGSPRTFQVSLKAAF